MAFWQSAEGYQLGAGATAGLSLASAVEDARNARIDRETLAAKEARAQGRYEAEQREQEYLAGERERQRAARERLQAALSTGDNTSGYGGSGGLFPSRSGQTQPAQVGLKSLGPVQPVGVMPAQRAVQPPTAPAVANPPAQAMPLSSGPAVGSFLGGSATAPVQPVGVMPAQRLASGSNAGVMLPLDTEPPAPAPVNAGLSLGQEQAPAPKPLSTQAAPEQMSAPEPSPIAENIRAAQAQGEDLSQFYVRDPQALYASAEVIERKEQQLAAYRQYYLDMGNVDSLRAVDAEIEQNNLDKQMFKGMASLAAFQNDDPSVLEEYMSDYMNGAEVEIVPAGDGTYDLFIDGESQFPDGNRPTKRDVLAYLASAFNPDYIARQKAIGDKQAERANALYDAGTARLVENIGREAGLDLEVLTDELLRDKNSGNLYRLEPEPTDDKKRRLVPVPVGSGLL